MLTGNAFTSDIKRQIRAVRAAVKARQKLFGEPQIGPFVMEGRRVAVRGEDGAPVLEEKTGPFGDAVRVPVTTVVYGPVPARIEPDLYHRLGHGMRPRGRA